MSRYLGQNPQSIDWAAFHRDLEYEMEILEAYKVPGSEPSLPQYFSNNEPVVPSSETDASTVDE